MIGLTTMIATAQTPNETSTPSTVETPEPTPTPTPTDIVCNELLYATIDAYISFIVTQDKDDASKSHSETYQRIFNRLKGVEAFTEANKLHLMHRLVEPMRKQYDEAWVTANSRYSVTDYVQAAALSGRQLSRICAFNGDPDTNYDFGEIVDFGCSRVWAVTNKPTPEHNPMFRRYYAPFGCEVYAAHSAHRHDQEYADRNHTHSGGW